MEPCAASPQRRARISSHKRKICFHETSLLRDHSLKTKTSRNAHIIYAPSEGKKKKNLENIIHTFLVLTKQEWSERDYLIPTIKQWPWLTLCRRTWSREGQRVARNRRQNGMSLLCLLLLPPSLAYKDHGNKTYIMVVEAPTMMLEMWQPLLWKYYNKTKQQQKTTDEEMGAQGIPKIFFFSSSWSVRSPPVWSVFEKFLQMLWLELEISG